MAFNVRSSVIFRIRLNCGHDRRRRPRIDDLSLRAALALPLVLDGPVWRVDRRQFPRCGSGRPGPSALMPIFPRCGRRHRRRNRAPPCKNYRYRAELCAAARPSPPVFFCDQDSGIGSTNTIRARAGISIPSNRTWSRKAQYLIPHGRFRHLSDCVILGAGHGVI